MNTPTKWRLVPAEPDQVWTDGFAARGPRIGSFISTIRAVLDTAPAPALDLSRTLREIRSSLAFLPAADAAITGLDRILQAVVPQDESRNDTGAFDVLSKLPAPVADARLRGLVQEAIAWIESSNCPAVSLCADLRDAVALPPVAAPKRPRDDDGTCWSTKETQRRQKEEDESHAALASAPVAGEEQPAVRKGETNG